MDFKAVGAEEQEEWIKVEMQLSRSLLNKIDAFAEEWGIKSRGAIIERLLQELLSGDKLFEEIINPQEESA